MKLIPWSCCDEIEAYTTCAYDEDKIINMSYNGIDDQQVLRNRQELALLLNTDLNHMVATLQLHTINFIEVSLKDGGKGMYSKDDAIVGFDAMYTRDKNLWLYSFHADCCPVLLYCRDQKIVAAIHSGWKGTVNEIVHKVVQHLIDYENCSPEHIYAYIGPSLSQESFEAKDDIIDLVKAMSFDTSSFYIQKEDGAYLLDSKGLIFQQLLNNHVLKKHITISPYCTLKDEGLFFSYRRNKTPHRHITCISLK